MRLILTCCCSVILTSDRKADAGMTSGVVISVVVFGIYDRFCPPALVLP
jgi:hypothetical protein